MEKLFDDMLKDKMQKNCKLMMTVTIDVRKKELQDSKNTYLLCTYILKGQDLPDPIDRKKALKIVQSEIRLLEETSKNGHSLNFEQKESLKFYKVCKYLLEGKYRDDTTRSE